MRERMATPDVDTRIDIATGEAKPDFGHRGGMSVSQWVSKCETEFYDRMALTQPARDSEEENHRMYTGLDYGQWDRGIVDECDRKNLTQFNVVLKRVNSTAGYARKNWYDVDFTTTDTRVNDDTTLVKDLYYIDKELCDWDAEFDQFLINGIIRSADLMMYIDYRHDSNFGNIGLKSMSPGTVLYDPNWTNTNTGEARNAYTVKYMTPLDMKHAYPSKKEEIDRMVYLQALQTDSDEAVHESQADVLPRRSMNDQYNVTYRVIEYHQMVTELKPVKQAFTVDGMFVKVPEDAEEAWFQTNKVDPETVMEGLKERQDMYYVTTFCPDLLPQEVLEEGYGQLQLGRLPFFHWSYNRHAGRDIGLVDLIKDPQRYYNEMMSLMYTQMKNGTRRATIIDPEIFGGDEAKQAEMMRKYTSGDAVVFTEPGALMENPNAIQQSAQSTPVNNEFNLANTSLDALEQITPINAAIQGNQGNERSAIQYETMLQQAETNMIKMQSTLKSLLNEIGEAYFYAAQDLYGGMYREFNSSLGNVEINVPLDDGRVLNDITSIPRLKVIVSESTEASSRKMSDRRVMAELLQYFGDNPLTSSHIRQIILSGMDSLDVGKKTALNEAFTLEQEGMTMNLAAQLEQAKAMMAQSSQMQGQAMMAPAPQEGEGVPMEEQQVQQ
ncbi:MAG: hypothetical protein GY941_22155 [Planctomycetes bacterium]|nr:hypothetical protein [Planctomycetota bacterium]